MPTTEHLNRPVCRHCGGADLASIERATFWQPVNYERSPEHGWTPGDDWGDQGDFESVTVGIACMSCYAETMSDDPTDPFGYDARQAITTAAAFARLPERLYRVTLVFADPEKPKQPDVVDPWTELPKPVPVRAKTAHLAGRAAADKATARYQAEHNAHRGYYPRAIVAA